MKILDVAKNEIGYVEGTNNDNKYGKEYGWNHVEWCCQFIWWCFNKAGLTSLFPKTASVYSAWTWYQSLCLTKSKSMYTPKQGDIIFFGRNYNHIGIVMACEGGIVTTIEGNAGENADRVKINSYNLKSSYIFGYATPLYNESEEAEIMAKEFEDDGYKLGLYKNGSTPENVYSDTDGLNKIGELNPYEECTKLGICRGMTIVVYKVDSESRYKCGFVEFGGL